MLKFTRDPVPEFALPMLAKWREDLPLVVEGKDPWRAPRELSEVDVADCVAAASAVFGIPVNDIMSDRRAKDIAYARFAAIQAARDLTRKSLPVIARAMNRADHTTIMHGLKRAEQLCGLSGEYAAKCRRVRNVVGTLQ